MLMAAGLGTRLRPFTDRIPKPLAPVLGVPCAEFVLQSLSEAGVSGVVANVHHLPAQTAAGLRAVFPGIEISDESGGLLGSAGGIRKALPKLDGLSEGSAFFVLNADTLCSLDLRELARTHFRLRRDRGVQATLALLERTENSSESYREVLVDASGDLIAGLGERTSRGRMYVGCAVIEREAVANLEEGRPLDFVEQILLPAIRARRAGAHRFTGHWMDIGSPQLWWNTHLELIELIESGQIPKHWLRLVERASVRLAPGVWASRASGLCTTPATWRGPCFWGGSGGAPSGLGPRAVLYGAPPEAFAGGPGIGALGLWHAFEVT